MQVWACGLYVGWDGWGQGRGYRENRAYISGQTHTQRACLASLTQHLQQSQRIMTHYKSRTDTTPCSEIMSIVQRPFAEGITASCPTSLLYPDPPKQVKPTQKSSKRGSNTKLSRKKGQKKSKREKKKKKHLPCKQKRILKNLETKNSHGYRPLFFFYLTQQADEVPDLDNISAKTGTKVSRLFFGHWQQGKYIR